MVRGTRENVHELMRQGESVLVFPGGAREVNQRKGEKYQLMWKVRLRFARLAIEHGYPIRPFAAVGAEEMLEVVLDHNNPVCAHFTGAIKKLTGWPMQPLVRGVGPTLVPKPERLCFWFGDPISTFRFAGRHRRPRRRPNRSRRGQGRGRGRNRFSPIRARPGPTPRSRPPTTRTSQGVRSELRSDRTGTLTRPAVVTASLSSAHYQQGT